MSSQLSVEASHRNTGCTSMRSPPSSFWPRPSRSSRIFASVRFTPARRRRTKQRREKRAHRATSWFSSRKGSSIPDMSGHQEGRRRGGSYQEVGIVTVTASSSDFIETLRASGLAAAVAHNAVFKQARLTSVLDDTTASLAEPLACCENQPGGVLRFTASRSVRAPRCLARASGTCARSARRRPAGTGVTQATGRGRSLLVATSTRASTSHTRISCRISTCRNRAPSSLRDDAHVPAGGTSGGRRLLEQVGGPGLLRPRTHTALSDRLGDHGEGIGVAPKATLVALKAGTAQGFFFTDSVVKTGITDAGDQRLDAVNMSFFADPGCSIARTTPSKRRSFRPSAVRRVTRRAGALCWLQRQVTRGLISTIRPPTRSAPISRRVRRCHGR